MFFCVTDNELKLTRHIESQSAEPEKKRTTNNLNEEKNLQLAKDTPSEIIKEDRKKCNELNVKSEKYGK